MSPFRSATTSTGTSSPRPLGPQLGLRGPRAALVATLGLAFAPAGAAYAGTVKGTVQLPPAPSEAGATPAPLANWRVENGVLPAMPAPEARGPVVVVLEPAQNPPGDPAPVTFQARPHRLDPHVGIGQVGAAVSIRNSDKVARTTYLKNGDVFMPREATAPGATRTVKFTLPGEYTLVDTDYPHGSARLFIVNSPYAVLADDKGGFNFEVPEGRYLLRAWFRGAWSEGQPVEITGTGSEKTVTVHVEPRGGAASQRERK